MANMKDLQIANLSPDQVAKLQETEAKLDSQHNGKIILLAFSKE